MINPDLYNEVNTCLPHILAKLADAKQFKLIHISTDAVFHPLSGSVTEKVPPDPIDLYGNSKFAGETKSHNSLNIRTSLLGFDPYHHRGLLEWIMASSGNVIEGYTNQTWSGCTTLQLSDFLFNLITKHRFKDLRKISNHYHFAPLGPNSKYELIKAFIAASNKKDIFLIPKNGNKINRYLTTLYNVELDIKRYPNNLYRAYKELISFEYNREDL